MAHLQGGRSKLDINDLLLNGSWKSTRAQSTSRNPTVISRPTTSDPIIALKPQRKNREGWPPRPIAEDETDALAKEHLGPDAKALYSATYEPPFRGTIDQHPIILESTVSTADAVKLHDKLHAECQAEDSGERRFVLIPRDDTHSPIRDDNESPRKSFTAPIDKSTKVDTEKRNLGRPEGFGPPFERRRSRQDLPSLQTEIPAPFRRSTSAYAYTPTSKQSTRSPRASGDFLLSPDAAISRSQSKGDYFDIPPKTAPRPSQGTNSTPTAEKRRSEAPNSRPSTPATPNLEKRNSAGSDTYPRARKDTGDKLTRPQLLSTDSGVRRSERAASTHSFLDPSDHASQRKGSTQPSRKNYSDSDDDQSSSDSDRRRRRHHHHRRHHRHQTQSSLRPEDDRDRHHRSGSKSTRSSDGKPGSRISSPLASPNISPSQLPPLEPSRSSRKPNSRPVSPLSGYSETPNDAGRSRARSPNRSRRSSPVAAPGTRLAPSTLPIPIPIPARVDLYSPGESRHSPSIPQYDSDHRRGSARPAPSPKPSPKPSWQPPAFQPPSESTHLDRPVGSYRRYSQDVDDGNIAPLPPCPRTSPLRGYNDWLTLPQCPSFNICPSCFDSTIAPTEFHAHFMAAPTKSSKEEVQCDFGSQPWYRIAWLLTRKERLRDLTLMSSLANIANTTPPCMGKYEAVRKWYSILDPATGQPIRNFDVCLACVKSIEALLPSLKGVFVRTDHKYPPDLPRVCDMRFDSKRFIHYFDALETAADYPSDPRYPPDTASLVALVKRFASVPECPRDNTAANSYWYIITQLPEFTVCAECFDEVVLPGMGKGKAIPAMFNKALQRKEVASCQLYSDRMRGIFEKAVNADDYKLLTSKARERKVKETQLNKELADLKGKKGVEKEIRRIAADWAKWE